MGTLLVYSAGSQPGCSSFSRDRAKARSNNMPRTPLVGGSIISSGSNRPCEVCAANSIQKWEPPKRIKICLGLRGLRGIARLVSEDSRSYLRPLPATLQHEALHSNQRQIQVWCTWRSHGIYPMRRPGSRPRSLEVSSPRGAGSFDR